MAELSEDSYPPNYLGLEARNSLTWTHIKLPITCIRPIYSFSLFSIKVCWSSSELETCRKLDVVATDVGEVQRERMIEMIEHLNPWNHCRLLPWKFRILTFEFHTWVMKQWGGKWKLVLEESMGKGLVLINFWCTLAYVLLGNVLYFSKMI